MKYTIFLTQRCNLACSYCYINKKERTLQRSTAEKIVDFIFKHAAEDQDIDIGFFGGEPLLEYNLLKQVVQMISNHQNYDREKVLLRVVSNGTLFSEDIADFLDEYEIGLGVSCDGPPHVQNVHRRFKNGRNSAAVVEKNIINALERFPLMPVNAVYSAESLEFLPETVDYLVELGVKNIHLNQDISSSWQIPHIEMVETIYSQIADRYLNYYLDGDPRYISLIDSKVTVLLRGGYQAEEKCSMGVGELSFGTTGNVYLCERLVGPDEGGQHCIGNVDQGITTTSCPSSTTVSLLNLECQRCSVKDYCMNWCGCTNFCSTGFYNKVDHFTCASEKAAIKAGLRVIEYTSENNITFSEHLAGTPLMSIMGEVST